MIIDVHCHASPIWYEPVETLLFQMDRLGVERATLVQMLGQFDNGYQQECIARYPNRLASIVGVDPSSPDGVRILRTLVNAGARGVRLRGDARSPGEDGFAIWRAALECRIPISVSGAAALFCAPEFATLVEAFPSLPFVIEHLGGLARPDVGDLVATAPKIFALARHKNVHLKLPGLGQLAARNLKLIGNDSPLSGDPAALIHAAYEAFGAERLMWGSDFPPVASREGYGNALQWTKAALAGYPSPLQAAIFGDTAARIFFAPR
jgi:L-fuconolactonase